MGKRTVGVFIAAAASLLFSFGIQAAQGEEAVRIEQIDLNAPTATVYGYGLDGEGEAEAFLGEERLQLLSAQPFETTGEGIQYYLLLDVSDSMPEAYFDKIKSGIASFYGALGSDDRINFITFGQEVLVRKEGKAGPEEIAAVLSDIDNRDRRTLLFEAVSQAAGMTEKAGAGGGRRVIIAISDGEDVAEGQKVLPEVLDELKEKSIPVYGLCIEDTARKNINGFGEFTRASGGDITIFDESQAETVLSQLRERLLRADVMQFEASSNRISNQYETFSLYLSGREMPLTYEVFSGRWIPDTNPPVILSARQLEGRKLEVTFSEAVTGFETAANYSIRKDGNVIPISAVAQSEEKENTVILTAAEALEAGTYTLSCSNICDDSQEANPVENTLSITLNASDPVIEPEERPICPFILLAVLLAGALLAAVFVFYRKLKKNRGVVFVEGKPVLASSVDIRQHVAVVPAQKKKAELFVSSGGKKPVRLEVAIDKSIIIGRSSICDVFFDDKRMSRQHFALEWDGKDMYITDLDTTNGTAVDGVKINGKRRLDNGAQIAAGSEEIRIKW